MLLMMAAPEMVSQVCGGGGSRRYSPGTPGHFSTLRPADDGLSGEGLPHLGSMCQEARYHLVFLLLHS